MDQEAAVAKIVEAAAARRPAAHDEVPAPRQVVLRQRGFAFAKALEQLGGPGSSLGSSGCRHYPCRVTRKCPGPSRGTPATRNWPSRAPGGHSNGGSNRRIPLPRKSVSEN